MAHFDAQYGATSGETERPHPEVKFTITPFFAAIIAGTKDRMTFAVPLTLMSIRRENSSAGTFQSGAGLFITPALLSKKSGAPSGPNTFSAHISTLFGSATSTTAKLCGAG